MPEDKMDAFREKHAILAFHVAALMVAVGNLEKARQQTSLGFRGNAGAEQKQVDYHRAQIKNLATSI